jgi:hypothetical protein
LTMNQRPPSTRIVLLAFVLSLRLTVSFQATSTEMVTI